MNDNNKQQPIYGGGIGFCGLLGIVFITLKLCGVINWSWWWVLAPIWIPFCFTISIILIILIFTAFFLRVSKIKSFFDDKKGNDDE